MSNIIEGVKNEGFVFKAEKEIAMVKENGILKKLKDQDGEFRYTRNDAIGLMSLFGKFDTRKKTVREIQMWIKTRAKLRKAYYEDVNEIKFTPEETEFADDFISGFRDKEMKEQPLNELEANALVAFIEQRGWK